MCKNESNKEKKDPSLKKHYTLNENVEEIINNGIKRADHWITLLEGENQQLFKDLGLLTDLMPNYGTKNNCEGASSEMLITHIYFNAHNTLKSIYSLYHKENSQTLVSRFILLRSLYETMCAVHYLAAFPEKGELFLDEGKRPKINELHRGFDDTDAADKMYRSVYNFLCSNSHPDGLYLRSHYIWRVYSLEESSPTQGVVTIGNIDGKVRSILFEAYFNYYLWMVQTNLLAPFLSGKMDSIPKMRGISVLLDKSLGGKRIKELKRWQDEFPAVSRFFDELGEMERNHRLKIIPVRDLEDLLSRIPSIYELRNNPEHVEKVKQLFMVNFDKSNRG